MPAVSRSACRAAYHPAMPVTPGPGRRRRRREVHARAAACATASARRPGGGWPATNVNAPPRMSPPMSDGLNCRPLGRGHRVRGEDALAEPGREPLHLARDELGRVERRVRGHVDVRPQHLLALRARASGRAPTAAPRARRGGRVTAPRATAFSLASTSARVPPRCTVGDRATSGCAHGMGPSSAKSTFAAAGPYAVAPDRAGVRAPAGRGG